MGNDGIGTDLERTTDVTDPCAVECEGVDLFFDAVFPGVIAIVKLEAAAAGVASESLGAVRCMSVLDQVVAVAIPTVDCDVVLHGFFLTRYCKYLDGISFNHNLNEEKLIRNVLPTAAKANSLA